LFNENLVYWNSIPMTTVRTVHSKLGFHDASDSPK